MLKASSGEWARQCDECLAFLGVHWGGRAVEMVGVVELARIEVVGLARMEVAVVKPIWERWKGGLKVR